MWWLALAFAALAAPVTFQVNDAILKHHPLEGVAVQATPEGGEPTRLGETDTTGTLAADLAPGTWRIAYGRSGYVPIPASTVAIPPEGLTVTATLSPLLEATGDAGRRRVQIVLNWGSAWDDVRDADAHLVCADGFEVYFGDRDHVGPDHEVRLDVDDVDWGGPETITLIDAPPGRYAYFVRNFSGSSAPIGASDLVVRVVLDDTPAGEFRPPADVDAQDWLPFEALVVEPDGRARIEPFSPEDLAAGADRRSDAAFRTGMSCDNLCCAAFVLPFVGWGAMAALNALRRRRRG